MALPDRLRAGAPDPQSRPHLRPLDRLPRRLRPGPGLQPSRASFMSGLSPHQTGVLNSDRDYFDRIPPARLWPHRLRQAGYHCSSGGKVMRGYAPLPAEVHDALYSDPPKLFPLGPRPRVLRAQGLPGRVELGGFRGGPVTTDPAEDAKLYDAQVAASAEAFFAGYDGAAPFYREIGFAGTHGPWTTPLRFKEMYDPKTVKRPRAWHAGFDPCPAMDAETPPNINTSHYRFWSKSLRNYFAAVSYVDDQLGRVWDALKASKHADDTLVILTSDHGLHLGERDRFRKHTLWEQVANVPLIVHDPTRPEARVMTDPVALMDIAPRSPTTSRCRPGPASSAARSGLTSRPAPATPTAPCPPSSTPTPRSARASTASSATATAPNNCSTSRPTGGRPETSAPTTPPPRRCAPPSKRPAPNTAHPRRVGFTPPFPKSPIPHPIMEPAAASLRCPPIHEPPKPSRAAKERRTL
ncbi:MAG: sulfatase-like hydrolase/transferase [Paracoccaceae bacterium]